MPTKDFTTKGIEALIAKHPAVRVDYFDKAHKGLCLRVHGTSAVWYAMRRVDGKLFRVKLGPYGDAMGLKEARAKLAELKEKIEKGEHPQTSVARERAKLAEARAKDRERLLSVLAPKWLEVHQLPTGKRSRTLSVPIVRDYKRHVAALVAEFGDRDIGTIRHSELHAYLEGVRLRSAAEANKAWTVLRRIFRYARGALNLTNNPAADIDKPGSHAERTRVLNRDEIRTVWRACLLAGYPYGHAMRFALCTGQRIGEVGALLRSDLVEDGAWWIQRTNKSRRRTDVHLASLARAIVESCPKFDDDKPHVFSATGGEGPLRSDIWSLAMRRHIEPAIELAYAEGLPKLTGPFTRHDLRRTVSTGLREWCLADHDAVERVLNHAVSGLRAHYDQATHRPRVEVTLKRWDQELRTILNPAPADKSGTVTSLQDQRRKRARSA